MIRSNFCFSWDLSPSKCHQDLKIYASDTKNVIFAHRAVLASHSCLLKTDMRKGADSRTLSAEILMDCGKSKH